MTDRDMLHAVRGAGVLDVLRVFVGPDGRRGARVGVVRDGSTVPTAGGRQAIAAELGFSATVFVDDPERGAVDLYAPDRRLTFAGHCCVGAAWLLDVPELCTPAGVAGVRLDGEFSWIEARPEWVLPGPAQRRGSAVRRYASAEEVDALGTPPPAAPRVHAWAWQDEPAGRVRAREFPDHDGTTGTTATSAASAEPAVSADDEATGFAALLLTEALGRALNIAQGGGCQILTAPQPEGWIEIGGRVVLDGEQRGLPY